MSRVPPPISGSMTPVAQTLGHADDQRRHQHAGNTVQPAEDRDRQRLDQQQRQAPVDALHAAPENAGSRCRNGRKPPGNCDRALDANADRPRRALIVGNRAHHDPGARVEDHDRGDDQRRRNPAADQIGAVDQHVAEEDRRLRNAETEPLHRRAEQARHRAAQQQLQSECQHHHHDDRLTDHAPEHRALDQNAEAKHDDNGGRHGKPHRQSRPGGEDPGDIGAHHRDGALGEVGGARGLVDQHDAERDQTVHRADQRAGQRELP